MLWSHDSHTSCLYYAQRTTLAQGTTCAQERRGKHGGIQKLLSKKINLLQFELFSLGKRANPSIHTIQTARVTVGWDNPPSHLCPAGRLLLGTSSLSPPGASPWCRGTPSSWQGVRSVRQSRTHSKDEAIQHGGTP